MTLTGMDSEITQVAGWLRPFLQAVESQGLDSTALLRKARLNPSIMDEAGARLPSRKMDELWRLAFEQGADLTLGLDYACHFQPGNLYVLAFGLYSSLNLQQASEHLLLPLRLLTFAAIVNCYVEDGEFHVEVSPTYPSSVHEKQLFFHGVLLNIWRSLSSADLHPIRVDLHDIPEPHDDAVWARLHHFFGCPVSFNASRSRMSLPLQLAQAPLQAANAELVAQGDIIIQRYLNELDQHHALNDVVHKVISKLSSGRFDRVTVAQELGISASTLQRRLAAEGTSFSQLLNDTRRSLAERYLLESRRSIKEVAYSLGFADLSNFTRAFRGWFGQSPREFRRQVASEATD
ncbi:MAG: AraC family transcriptional regulator ligand-binding domain-containing protein [Pedobacter sp.]|nr:AraC family transcriptional regulator ligand-binding domain-containing protein [Pedobacter sp.]